MRLILPLFILGLSLFSFSARAERYGHWGPGNWGGWDFYPRYWGGGDTVPGSILRGMGMFLQGAGNYNLLTSEANSINANTWMRLNEYLYQARLEQIRRYSAMLAANKKKASELTYLRYLRLRDFPNNYDIQAGDAINLKVRLLTDPNYADVVFDALKVEITQEFIETIPLARGAYGVSTSLESLKKGFNWPSSFQSGPLSDFRAAIEQAMANITASNFKGAIQPEVVEEFASLVGTLRSKLGCCCMGDVKANVEPFVLGLERLVTALKADYGYSLYAISNLENRTLGGLLKVMRNERVRFGRAHSSKENALYQDLYSVLKSSPTLLDEETLKKLAEVMENFKG